MGLFDKLFGKKQQQETLDQGLQKTREGFFSKITKAIAGKSTVDEEVLDDVEDALVSADVGIETTVEIIVRIEKQDPLTPEVHFALYRVVQEALNNIARHALASQIEVYFNSDSGHVDLTIQDDGLGFEPDNIGPGHLGLSIMKDRIQSIGGSLETISHKGEGTRIKVIWVSPIHETLV